MALKSGTFYAPHGDERGSPHYRANLNFLPNKSSIGHFLYARSVEQLTNFSMARAFIHSSLGLSTKHIRPNTSCFLELENKHRNVDAYFSVALQWPSTKDGELEGVIERADYVGPLYVGVGSRSLS